MSKGGRKFTAVEITLTDEQLSQLSTSGLRSSNAIVSLKGNILRITAIPEIEKITSARTIQDLNFGRIFPQGTYDGD